MLSAQPSGLRAYERIQTLAVPAFWIALAVCILPRPAAAADTLQGICSEQPGGSSKVWVFADFDGDKKLDLAIVSTPAQNDPAKLRRITIRPLEPGAFPICAASGTERLRARDLDGDADRDLVLETATAEPIAVWINDGSGHFSEGKVADFRYQLSHYDPRSLDSVALVPVQQDTVECPTTGIAARATAGRVCFIDAALNGNPERNCRSGFTFSIRSRGPPRQS